MNEALRLLRRVVRGWGYDLKKHEQFVLRPVPGIDKLAQGPDLRAAKNLFDQDADVTSASDLSRLTVYIRTCLKDSRNVNPRPRLTGLSDMETSIGCLRSIVRSINRAAHRNGGHSVKVIALDDRSNENALNRFEQILKDLNCPHELRTTNETGQGPSLHEQFSDARSRNTLCYFVEDDYLHESEAIIDMWDFYLLVHSASGGHCVIYPQEHKDLYEGHYPSYILAGPTRRWRTMANATHTFFAHGQTVDRYWDYFEKTQYVGIKTKRHLGAEKNNTNRLYDHIPGFSPIPAVAVHLQYEELLPPFFDWQRLWDENTS